MSEKVKQALVLAAGVIVIGGVIGLQVWRARPAPPVVPGETASTPATDPSPAGGVAPPTLPVACLPTPLPTATATLSEDPETAAVEATEIPIGQWGRNPFLTLDEIAGLIPESDVPILVPLPEPNVPAPALAPELPAYTVSMIVSGDKGAWAVVGSRIVRQGSRLGAETVTGINSDGIVLEFRGETRVIPLQRLILFAPGRPRGGNE